MKKLILVLLVSGCTSIDLKPNQEGLNRAAEDCKNKRVKVHTHQERMQLEVFCDDKPTHLYTFNKD